MRNRSKGTQIQYILLFKSLGSEFFKEMNTLFSKDALNWSKVTVKTLNLLQYNQINAFGLSIHQRIQH